MRTRVTSDQQHVPLPPAIKKGGSTALYTDGTYLQKNPSWHVDESSWKATQIMHLLNRHKMTPNTICEIGCGAGEVLRQLQQRLTSSCVLCGYDISPQAYELCKERANDRLSFKLMDIRQENKNIAFDLVLILDVIEHLEDYFSFLRDVRPRGRATVLHIPLDLSAQTVLRQNGLMKRRDMYAHLHYFTKEIALQLLKDVGYEILDYAYTPRSNELGSELIQKVLKVPRLLGFALHEDFTVRAFGGYSLLVLAR
jgi:cyclopropane fatty-acyl-phospholipid synthase-like methyltransferase